MLARKREAVGEITEVHTGRVLVLVRKPEVKYLENPSVDGYNKTSFKRIKEDSVDWTDVAQNRAKWRAVVNKVMSLHVP